MATTKATTLAHRTIPTSAITSGTFADARIAVSNVTQHEASIDNLAANPSIALGSNAQFPAGHILSVQNVYPTEGANDYEFSISHSSSPTTVGGVTLGSGGTNALSSSSNKLIVSVSAIGVMNSDVSSDHWRLFVQGTGMPDPSTHTNADGFPLNLNFYYEITHYHEEILSTQLLVTPGTTTPSYYIRCVNAQGSGTFTIKHINWVFMEVQA